VSPKIPKKVINERKPGYVPGFLGKVPLERVLSKLGFASRKQTRQFINEGRIKVNGKTVRDGLFQVAPETDQIMLDGKAVKKAQEITVMLNKPRGIVTTKSDEKGRKTIYSLLPQELQHLHPVGRLDMATTGLLILTTDTQLSNFLTDPLNEIPRTYVVTVEGRIDGGDLVKMQNGIEDNGEILKTVHVEARKVSNKESHLTMTLTEGKNREIRRMMEALGHEVTALKRISFGDIDLGDLKPGEYKEVRV